MVDWFADFARVVYKEYAPKVKRFIPINEPTTVCKEGYTHGKHAPGKHLYGFGEYLCIHNMLKAHARAYRIYEEEFNQTYPAQIGFLVNLFGYLAENPNDVLAPEIAYEFNGGWTLHPIYSKTGDYPEVMKDMVAANSRNQGFVRSRLPVFTPEWIEYIRYCINSAFISLVVVSYYTVNRVHTSAVVEKRTFSRML